MGWHSPASRLRLLLPQGEIGFPLLVSGPPGATVSHWLAAFKIRSTESIVLQLRVVAEAPKSSSIRPRKAIVRM